MNGEASNIFFFTVMKNNTIMLSLCVCMYVCAAAESGAAASSRNLWVSGLSSTTRATDLKTLFSKYGKVSFIDHVIQLKLSVCFLNRLLFTIHIFRLVYIILVGRWS